MKQPLLVQVTLNTVTITMEVDGGSFYTVMGRQIYITHFAECKLEKVSINYKLHSVDKDWRVYDLVIIEDISLINNYRSQFNRVIARSSFEELVRTRNLAGSALSRYVDCGAGMTGPRADSHRVQMPLLLFIDAAPEGKTKLRIALAASAQDNSGTSNSPVTCGSTGALEGQLRRAIGAQLALLP